MYHCCQRQKLQATKSAVSTNQSQTEKLAALQHYQHHHKQ